MRHASHRVYNTCSRSRRSRLMRGARFGRSLAAATALSSTVCSTAVVETRAYIAHHHSSTCFRRSAPPPARSFRRRRSCFSGHAAAAGHAGQDSKDEDRAEEETYGEDDERRFWDTAMEVLERELSSTKSGCHEAADLSRIWDFVAHNREGRDPPVDAPSSFRATGLYFPGLEAKPWWDRSEFPWLQDLEEAATDITAEMKRLARAGGQQSYRGGSGEMSTVYDATQGWGTMRLRYMGRFGQPGVNYALLPRTLSALRELPLAPETAAFQRQLPGTGLPLHVDPSNFVLGCHLGVVIPPPIGNPSDRRNGKSGGTSGRKKGDVGRTGSSSTAKEMAPVGKTEDDGLDGSQRGGAKSGGSAAGSSHRSPGVGSAENSGGKARDAAGGRGEKAWIEVAGEKRHWETGGAFVFDPSFLHRTRNPTEGERVILNIDIWHPNLSEVEKTAIRRVCELVEQWNARSGVFEK
ncbi:unnamed protein product [Scytosiphon promiscuus]